MKGRVQTAPQPRRARPHPTGSRNPWSAVRLIVPYLERYRLRIAGGFAALITVDFLQLWIPRIIKSAVDDLQTGAATSARLLLCGGYILLIALLIAALRYVWRQLLLGFSRLVEMHLRNRMMAHILTLDKAFFQQKTTGAMMALATNDLSSVQMAMGMGLVAAVDALFMGLAAFVFMAVIDYRLTLIAAIPMPVLVILTRFLSARLHRRFKTVQEQFSTLTEFVRSSLQSMRLIKAYNQEYSQVGRFNRLGETYVRNNLKLASIYGALFPLSALIGNVSLLLVLNFGGRMTMQGTITAGDFVAFITYLFMLAWPMMAIGWVADLFQRGVTSLDRIDELLQARPALENPKTVSTRSPGKTIGIRIKDLSFSYVGQKRPALSHLSLDIRPGLFLGIVGRTGSGKTTLCNLLARLYSVPPQTVFFNGLDVNDLALETVRGAIAYVPQEIVLFSDSVAFNITLGRKDAGREDIERVARAAAIHDEIMAMSDGYQTRIGERGVKLSGGQRQRLAIARALLLDRPIIMIDDGLSAVDMETEHAIIHSIAEYLRGHTCIVVSHRIAPLADAEQIVVMDEGRVVERGSHSQLLASSRFYATIYEQQINAPHTFSPTSRNHAT